MNEPDEKIIKAILRDYVFNRDELKDELLNSEMSTDDYYNRVDRLNETSLKSAFLSGKEESKNAILPMIAEIEKNNPYPPDIFIEPTKEEYKEMQKAVEKAGLVPDKFFGSSGRKVWANCINKVKERIKE